MKKANSKQYRAALKLLICAAYLLSIIFITCEGPVEPSNKAPIILSLTPSKKKVNFQEAITIKSDVKDADGDSITFLWTSDEGNFSFTSLDSAVWNAPNISGPVSITLKVNDPFEGQDQDSTIISVNNQGPVITAVNTSQTNILVGNYVRLSVEASDPDGGDLTYRWETNGGEFISSVTLDSVLWRASTVVDNVTIRVTVTDENGGFAFKDVELNVFQEIGSVWIADTFNNQVVKLSSNGTELLRLSGFNQPRKIALDLRDRSIWITDWGNNRLVKYSSTGDFYFEVTDLERPSGIAVQENGNVWVTTRNDSAQVLEVSYNGTILRRLMGFSDPLSIDVERLTGTIWIADTGNDRIVTLQHDVPDNFDLDSTNVFPKGDNKQFINYTNPESVVIDQVKGYCWISDTGNHRVVRIIAETNEEFIIAGFLNPRGIDVNIKDGSCWVANTGNNEVIRIMPEIFQLTVKLPWAYNITSDAGFHFELDGFSLPWSVSINSTDNVVWFSDDFRVLKVSDEANNYSIIKTLVNFNAPKSIVVNPGIKP